MRICRLFRRRKRTPQPSEATMARLKAERDLDAVRAETPHYQALGAKVRAIRERNHISELFYAIHRE